MANITVSPTRMELTRLKGKLKTAQRGHKLLKDKRDELMKQFLDTVREVRSLRAEVEEDLMRVHKSFTVASALMSSEALEQALLYPKQSVELTRTTQNIMSVNVPVYDFQTKTKSDSDIYPYGFAATSGELDDAVEALGLVFRKMLKLAQIEKSAAEADKKSGPAPEADKPAKSDYDELLPQAVDVILETKQASVSMLQRRLKLGYSRAARMVDQMEEMGIVGPFEGSKPRKILITKQQWQEMQFKQGLVDAAPEPVPDELEFEGDAVPQSRELPPFDLED